MWAGWLGCARSPHGWSIAGSNTNQEVVYSDTQLIAKLGCAFVLGPKDTRSRPYCWVPVLSRMPRHELAGWPNPARWGAACSEDL